MSLSTQLPFPFTEARSRGRHGMPAQHLAHLAEWSILSTGILWPRYEAEQYAAREVPQQDNLYSLQEIQPVVGRMKGSRPGDLAMWSDVAWHVQDVRRTPLVDRSQELRWLDAHRAEYVGQWVALHGDRLIASGPNAEEVFAAARESAVARPLIVQVEGADPILFGGW